MEKGENPIYFKNENNKYSDIMRFTIIVLVLFLVACSDDEKSIPFVSNQIVFSLYMDQIPGIDAWNSAVEPGVVTYRWFILLDIDKNKRISGGDVLLNLQHSNNFNVRDSFPITNLVMEAYQLNEGAVNVDLATAFLIPDVSHTREEETSPGFFEDVVHPGLYYIIEPGNIITIRVPKDLGYTEDGQSISVLRGFSAGTQLYVGAIRRDEMGLSEDYLPAFNEFTDVPSNDIVFDGEDGYLGEATEVDILQIQVQVN